MRISASAALVFVLLSASLPLASQDDEETVWSRQQLNEAFMRSLTKHQCMMKTINTLGRTCGEDMNCIKAMAGVIGDCVEWASGDIKEVCSHYQAKYIDAYCKEGGLDSAQCLVLRSHKLVACDRRGM